MAEQSETGQRESNKQFLLRQGCGGQYIFFARMIVILLGLMLLSRDINAWFTGWREDTSALYGAFAHNHARYGFGYTKLFHTYGTTINPPAKPERYLNNPPLLSVWVALPMLIFGDHEWVIRSVSIAATLGSVWILMVIISRLQSPVLGLLTGFFYVMLPVTAYFGRVVEYPSATQFFSLLMLHGYLQWTGFYGNGYSRKAGAAYYVLGVVLGTGTGWAAAIMAALIWGWHIFRAFYNRSLSRYLPWLTVIPVLSLAAVMVHILWGCGWKAGWLGSLLSSRVVGPEKAISWAEWFSYNWGYLRLNVSWFGIAATVIYLVIVPAILLYTVSDSPLRQVVRNGAAVIPIFLTALQGLIWTVVFNYESCVHDYWQYFSSPFFAAAMAAIVFAAFTFFSIWTPRSAAIIAVLLVLLPAVSFVRLLEISYQIGKAGSAYNIGVYNLVSMLMRLNRYVPPNAAVMVSENYESSQHIGDLTGYKMVAQAAYYANRPLIYSTDVNEIDANRRQCAAYVLKLTKEPNTLLLAQELAGKYKLAGRERDYLIFLLNPHSAGE